jgi:hypothetical protein
MLPKGSIPGTSKLMSGLLLKGGVAMRTYERPTLIKAGSFKKLTGEGGSGPRDLLVRHQML